MASYWAAHCCHLSACRLLQGASQTEPLNHVYRAYQTILLYLFLNDWKERERIPNYRYLVLFMGQLMQAGAIFGIVFNFVSVRVELHCKEPILKIRNKYSQKNRSWEYMYINRSQTHACGNWNWGRSIRFLGIFGSNVRKCVFAVYYISTRAAIAIVHFVIQFHAARVWRTGTLYQKSIIRNQCGVFTENFKEISITYLTKKAKQYQ